MAKAKNGDKVRVHYHGTLSDGSVFDSSLEREPMEFVLGQGELLPGFEAAVLGMEAAETKTIHIPCEEAYGIIHDEFVVEAPRSIFPPDIELKTGVMLQIPTEDGGTAVVRIGAVSEETVILDGNHPLAGQDLTFELTLAGIV